MGSNKTDPWHLMSHTFGHISRVDSFDILEHEVTNAQYQKCVVNGTCSPPTQVGELPRSYKYAENAPQVWAKLPCLRRSRTIPALRYDTWRKKGQWEKPVVCVNYSQAAEFAAWVGGCLPSEAEWELAANRTHRSGKVFEWTRDGFHSYRVQGHLEVIEGEKAIRGGKIISVDSRRGFALDSSKYQVRASAFTGGSYYWLGFRVSRGGSCGLKSTANSNTVIVRKFAQAAQKVVFQPYDFSKRHKWKLYRVPAIIRTLQGTVLIAVEGRDYDHDFGRTGIVLRTSIDNGISWLPERDVAYAPDKTYSTPLFVQESGGTILLFYSVSSKGSSNYDSGQLCLIKSKDEGKTWTQREMLFENTKAGPGHGLQLRSGKFLGRIIVPARYEGDKYPQGAYAIYSDDGGTSWARGEMGQVGGSENQMVELSPGSLLSIMRPVRGKYAQLKVLHTSTDGGKSWGKASYSKWLQEPMAACSITSTKGLPGHERPLLLYSCPPMAAKDGADHIARRSLTVRISKDDGGSWPYALLIQSGPAGYSDMALGSDGETVHIVYERGIHRWDEEIVYSQFNVSDVLASEIRPHEALKMM